MLHSVSYEYGFIDIKKVRKILDPVLEFYLSTGDMVVSESIYCSLFFPYPALAVAPKIFLYRRSL